MFLHQSFSAESCQTRLAWAGQAYARQVDFRPNWHVEQDAGPVEQDAGFVCSNMLALCSNMLALWSNLLALCSALSGHLLALCSNIMAMCSKMLGPTLGGLLRVEDRLVCSIM